MTDTMLNTNGVSDFGEAPRRQPEPDPMWLDPKSRLRNCTPDRLVIKNADGQSLVISPLAQEAVDEDERIWPWRELLRRRIASWQAPPKRHRDLSWFPNAAAVIGVIGIVTISLVIGMNPGWSASLLWSIGVATYVLVLGVALKIWGRPKDVAPGNSGEFTRKTAQLVMLAFVVVASIGIPAAAVWYYDENVLSHDLSAAARVILMAFLAVATMLPGLLFFFFDRQRLSTLRDRFEQHIFRLDPNVTTLSDVDARYGRQIAEAYYEKSTDTGARLPRQGRWPIVIATVTLAMGWILTVMPIGELETKPIAPDDIADLFAPLRNPVAFGFLGAYFYSLNLCLRRYARNDLRPKTYSAITVRVMIAVILAWLLEASVPEAGRVLLVVAFLTGIVPETTLKFIRELVRDRTVRTTLDHMEEQQPLQELEGIDLYDRSRLLDEGIANIEGLAHDDLIDLMLETRIPTARLVDWIDQAVLFLHLVDPMTPDKKSAGTVRRRLRALGIRTATDLEAAYEKPCLRDALAEALQNAVNSPGDGRTNGECRLGILLVAISDDEWMPYLRNWRAGAMVHERRIELARDGAVLSDTRTELPTTVICPPDAAE